MLARLRSSNIANPRDVVLYAGLGVALLAFTIVWALFLTDAIAVVLPNTMFMLLVVVVFAILAALVPRITYGRNETHPNARLAVRLGLALEIFGLLITPVGIFYATNPVISVPVGFAGFLAVFFGTFIAGFGGNVLAPKRA